MFKKMLFSALILSLVTSGSAFASINKVQILETKEPFKITYIQKELKNVKPEIVNGKTMIPISHLVKEMGYDVKWNGLDKTVEIVKGAQFTNLKIGDNSYFKAKMAPFKLSSEPIIIKGRTFVPVEFFHEVLSAAFYLENGVLDFKDVDAEYPEQLASHFGIVRNIEIAGNTFKYSISNIDSTEVHTVISASNETTIFQKQPKVGDTVNFVSPPIMLMSYPGQTGSIVIY